MGEKSTAEQLKDNEVLRREDEALKRLLAMPPQPKTKPKPGVGPKKRGRPKKDSQENG